MENLQNKTVIADSIQCNDKGKWGLRNNLGIRIFTEDEIERITSNYSTPIGKGGFGEVYRGVDCDEHYPVAVKRYIRGDLRKEFIEEVNIHGQINHKNVVKLIGYCEGENTLTMVTEYISKGNLEDTLHNSGISIPLDTRLGIAIGCAEALSYMHSMHLSADSLVCHGDIKPANILLDVNLTAKLSDFGLSRFLPGGITKYTIHLKGSYDYMDPIYLRDGRLTAKNDVYSFGVVLLELIARKRVKEGSLIATFSVACQKGIGLGELFDAKIADGCNIDVLEEIGKLATQCLTLDPSKRPGMDDVLKRLVASWKALRRGEGNIGWRLRTQMRGNVQASSFSSLLRHVFDISQRKPQNSDIRIKLGNRRIFTKEELKEITKNYSCSFKTKNNSFGLLKPLPGKVVYKGTLEDNTPVAVRNGKRNEAIMLSEIDHKNIIKLLGFCLESEVATMVYEHASKGNLRDILRRKEEYFPLELRLNVAMKIAEAVAYLHSSAAGVILHGFIRSSSILLDDNFRPKLSNFMYAMKVTEGMYTDFAQGAFIYTDPFYFKTHLLTVKSDVYCFGIVLLELISRKKNQHEEDGSFIDRITEACKTYASSKTIFEKEIAFKENIRLLRDIGELGLSCTNSNPNKRPTMKKVAALLRIFGRGHVARTNAGPVQHRAASSV